MSNSTKVQTIELTSKKLKAHQIANTLLFLFLILMMIVSGRGTTVFSVASYSLIICPVWALITKFRIWWSHK